MSFINNSFGIPLAISSGCANHLGLVLQKKVVNTVPPDAKLGRSLLKRPLWIAGLLLELVLGSILFMISEFLIGPVLVPGLMAAGLIVLAIGSAKINKERLQHSEILGIGIMILAIALLAFSFMSVSPERIEASLHTILFLVRLSVFTCTLLVIAAAFHVIKSKNERFRGISLAIFSGLMFALSNFWVSILLVTIVQVFTLTFDILELILFIISAIVIVATNYLGILKIQQAFQHGQASNLIPIQQVPIQIMPILYYFTILYLPGEVPLFFPFSIIFLISGIGSIMASSFLLARVQASFEKTEPTGSTGLQK